MKKPLAHLSISTMLALGMRGASKASFGDDSIFRREVKMLPDKAGGHRKKFKGHGCTCRDPMPLSKTELDLLAGFPPGREKKKFVKQLKIKYGKV